MGIGDLCTTQGMTGLDPGPVAALLSGPLMATLLGIVILREALPASGALSMTLILVGLVLQACTPEAQPRSRHDATLRPPMGPSAGAAVREEGLAGCIGDALRVDRVVGEVTERQIPSAAVIPPRGRSAVSSRTRRRRHQADAGLRIDSFASRTLKGNAGTSPDIPGLDELPPTVGSTATLRTGGSAHPLPNRRAPSVAHARVKFGRSGGLQTRRDPC
jgi:hypothetical protein